MINIIVITIIIFIISIFVTPAFADEPNLGYSRITPASPLYFLKSVREILELKFAGTAHIRVYRQLEFATRRIREVKSLAQTSGEDLIEPILIRYLSDLQDLNSVLTLSNEDIASRMTATVILHMEALQAVYRQVSHPRARMSIRTTIFRLSEWEQDFADKLYKLTKPYLAEKVILSKVSACNFLSKEASSSALNEVEKVVFLERAQKCFSTNQ